MQGEVQREIVTSSNIIMSINDREVSLMQEKSFLLHLSILQIHLPKNFRFQINRIYLPFNILDNKYPISRVSINLQFTKKQESQEANKLYPEENLRL